jgi:hypothetical protein
MCDYSLEHVASTPAKEGDRLVTTGFAMSSTRGFCAEGRPDVAVCLRPGTELAFDEPVRVDRALGLFQRQANGATVARFREINTDQPLAHHDALEFPDGEVILVTQLSKGQRATVLQLPRDATAVKPAGQTTVAPPAASTATEPRPARTEA